MSETRTSENGESSSTVVLHEEPVPIQQLRLKLRKPKAKKKVGWTAETIDNENLNKKKSKCCCIFEKPKQFDESSDEEDDDCENCRGHVEKKAHKKRPNSPSQDTEKLPSPDTAKKN